MTAQLVSYASGDGAISFTYIEERFNRSEGCFEKIAVDGNPTREEVEAIRQSRFPDYLIIQFGEPTTRQQTIQVEVPGKKRRGRPPKNPLLRQKTKTEEQVVTVEVPPQFRLCSPVFRVGPTTLRIDDTIYRYSVDKENIFWTRDGRYTEHNLFVEYLWCISDELPKEEPQEVKNLNTRAAILWFLNHEKTIVQQYPDQDETTAATVDQLKAAVQNLQRAGMSPEDINRLMEDVT